MGAQVKFFSCVLALLLVNVLGCSFRPKAPVPDITGRELSPAEREQLIDKLAASDSAIKSLRALARASIADADGRVMVRYAFVFEKPRRLRLEMLPVNGFYTMSLLALDADKAVLLEPGEKRAIESRDGNRLLERFLRAPLSASDLMSFLTGRVPQALNAKLRQAEQAVFRYDAKTNTYGMATAEEDLYLIVDAKTLLLKKAQLRGGFTNDASLELRFEGETSVKGVLMPQALNIQLVEHATTIDLTFTTITLNPVVSEALFRVEVPEGWS